MGDDRIAMNMGEPVRPVDGDAGIVLLVEDNADVRLLYALILEQAGWTVLQADDGAVGIDIARSEFPEVIVCDLMMPGVGGLGVLEALRADPLTAAIPIVMVTATGDTATVVKCMQAGAHDYLVKTAHREELLVRCAAALRVSRQHRRLAESERELRLLTDELRYQAGHDPLTGLPNRALLAERITTLLGEATGRGLAVVFLDLDGFKSVNDNHGHLSGDELLVGVSRRLQSVVRIGDTVARIGGDEFVLVLPGIAEQALAPLVHRIEEAMCRPFRLRAGTVTISSSTGTAVAPPNRTAEQLLAEADQAMYRAKALSRRAVT